MSSEPIIVTGAHENNLQNLTLSFPTRQIVALAGVSGAGKSTLAHNIVARVARRRLGRLRGEPQSLAPSYEPAVSSVSGLPPCIELPQEPLRGQSRSTVATYTGLLDFLAGLFLHYGESRSPTKAPILPLNKIDFADWIKRHHSGKTVTLAEIGPDQTVSSIGHLPDGIFYYRGRRTGWTASTRASAKSALPVISRIAVQIKRIKVNSARDAANLVPSRMDGCLWHIGDDFIETGVHRLAADDATIYEPLGRRLFSFNASGPGGGQCPACAGLGVTQGVSEQALIRSNDVPLLEGGLNLAQSSTGRFTHLGVLDDILRGLFCSRNVPANISWGKLTPDLRKVVMYGSGTVSIPELPRGEKRLRGAKRPFAGIIPLIIARARSTGSAAKVFQQWITENQCPDCAGSRFNESARACQWREYGLADLVSQLTLGELRGALEPHLRSIRGREADFLQSIVTLLSAFEHLNLGHLPLSRATSTLSGGEAQRLKIGLGLALEMREICYILDEPSRGLHVQDVAQLTAILRSVVRDDNTILLVEHHPLLLQNADQLITLGPGGGSNGGRVIYQGPAVGAPQKRLPLNHEASIRRQPMSFIEVKRLSLHNLHNVEFSLPFAHLTAVVGVSGAGKTSAILRALVPASQGMLEGTGDSPICKLKMPKGISFVEVIGQKLSGQNRRSIVATVLEILDPLRRYFAALPDSIAMNLDASDFSFNSIGACVSCGGTGVARDGFGEETDARCHVCEGTRLAGAALLVRSQGQGIADILGIPVASLVENPHPAFNAVALERLAALVDLGLGHLSLGRATPTLSVGERQRLALARFLARLELSQGAGLLVLDEPSAGLSVSDATRVFQRVRKLSLEQGHTVVVLEHKLELLPLADWILEFGPGGGPAGGRVIFEGTALQLSKAQTPTATAWKNRKINTVSPDKKRSKAPKADNIPWERCAAVFESIAARSEIHDDDDLTRPVRPAVLLRADRIPKDTRVGEILDLLPWVRAKCSPIIPPHALICSDTDALAAATEGHSFGFSPVAPQLRLGLATLGDLQSAVRALLKLGFRQARINKREILLRDLPTKVISSDDIASCLVVCPHDISEELRATARRWSQGVIHLFDKGSNRVLVTQFVDRPAIGLGLKAPFVGDFRSPQGRCAQCVGTGRLPTYPWSLIVADERKTIADDKFWNPAVLKGIRSLRQTRIVPEAKYFAKHLVADFQLTPIKMDKRTRFHFEHGLPWRKFLKPSAQRSDREQDYYSWRGLHDYVYLSLGQMKDEKHKQKLKDGFQEIFCPMCEGTGMGWESAFVEWKNLNLRQIWRSMTLAEWKAKLGCSLPSLAAAVKLGHGKRRPNDLFFDLNPKERDDLLISMSHTSPLVGLTLVSTSKHQNAQKIVKQSGMKLYNAKTRLHI